MQAQKYTRIYSFGTNPHHVTSLRVHWTFHKPIRLWGLSRANYFANANSHKESSDEEDFPNCTYKNNFFIATVHK